MCQGKDHFAKVCCTKGGKPKQNVYNVDGREDFAFAIDHMSERLNFCVGGVNIKMLIDSCATSNLMGENAWENFKAESIKYHSCCLHVPKTERKLYSYSSNQPLTVKGEFTCEVSIGKKTTS